MIFKNSTSLDQRTLVRMFQSSVDPWPTDGLDIRVRYSRGSDFSGACYYETSRLYVNLGRHLTYPYLMATYLARAVSSRSSWWKPLYSIELASGYDVVLFILLHEYYHWMIKRAGRNTRRKESMCDRFAARVLVDQYAAVVRNADGARIGRDEWDFQDLERFVAFGLTAQIARRARPVVARQSSAETAEQLVLFGT